MTCIPVLVHHESNAKCGDKGRKKTQLYVKHCVDQAKKYNQKVILFGDEYNRGFSEEWYDVSSFFCEKWGRFLEVFENMSYYSLSWAKSFFKRFYVFEEWMRKNDVKECIVLDSDILVYRNFSDGMFDDYDVALEIEKDQNMSVIETPNGLMWAAIAGVAYFTIDAIADFTSFCIDIYKNQKYILKKKWDIHLKHHLPGGICEMTLLYLWYQSKSDIFQFKNLYCECENSIGCLVINGNGNGYLKKMYDVDKKTQLLKIDWKREVPYVIEKKSDRKIKVDSLHFGGDSKCFMVDIYKYKRFTVLSYLKWCYRDIRKRLVYCITHIGKNSME